VTSTGYSSNDPHRSHFIAMLRTTNSRIVFQAMYTEDYRESGTAVLYSILRCGKELTVPTNVEKH